MKKELTPRLTVLLKEESDVVKEGSFSLRGRLVQVIKRKKLCQGKDKDLNG
jgi:hypothetical protein